MQLLLCGYTNDKDMLSVVKKGFVLVNKNRKHCWIEGALLNDSIISFLLQYIYPRFQNLNITVLPKIFH